MQNSGHGVDATVILGAAVVFGLPVALLIPDFSVWDLVPKIQVHRFHILSHHFDWRQLNIAIVTIAFLLFCLCLEFRKRILDDMTEEVFTVQNATASTMEAEKEREATTMRTCLQLLDASKDHYEALVILQDELRQWNKNRGLSPIIELNCDQKVK